MNKIQPRTLKGFRDFLPKEARKRQYVIETLRRVFESYGFEPLETPTMEYEDILMGKYGEEEKLIYKFETQGGDRAALRYDQTVPLARVVAQYGQNGAQILPTPFKRYQIQTVFRGENTQKGRYREFVQCDADTIGIASVAADAEILNLIYAIYNALGLPVTIKINDRVNFSGLESKYIAAIDKLEKIGESAVLSEMMGKGMEELEARNALSALQTKPITENLAQIIGRLEQMGADISKISYEPTLARGLDYYTGMIFETVADGASGSICSGGRWNKMIGNFTSFDMPAVGFGLGFDRTIEVMEEKGLFPSDLTTTKVLVTIPSPEQSNKSNIISSLLRSKNINTEVYLDEKCDMGKQFKYAEKKEIPYVVVPVNENEVELRKKTGEGNIEKETINIDLLIEKLQGN